MDESNRNSILSKQTYGTVNVAAFSRTSYDNINS